MISVLFPNPYSLPFRPPPVTLQTMPKAAIISKPQKAELEHILPELVGWLAEHGFDYILDPESAEYLKSQSEDAIERQFMPEHSPDLVVMLGGDGTLLAAARAFAFTNTPILAV